ncbi:hypothetical protein BaRGS_00029010 [Batillaria attramentaria]|uniref:AIG1-type G domain-containing protein n=1 Tax=Batillaria attramentaria TaxID=370345 RepID=A0ABD0JXD0_9CAEN
MAPSDWCKYGIGRFPFARKSTYWRVTCHKNEPIGIPYSSPRSAFMLRLSGRNGCYFLCDVPVCVLDRVIRLVMIGKTGTGKSATGNSIIGAKDAFDEKRTCSSATRVCKKRSVIVNGTVEIQVVDTPGVLDTDRYEGSVEDEIRKCLDLSAPGPHAFIMTLNLCHRFTAEEYRAYEIFKRLFGREILNHIIVCFTHGDQLEEQEKTSGAVRLVLLGVTYSGKSATGNSIIGSSDAFETFRGFSGTEDCQQKSIIIGNTEVQVVDTPGVFNFCRPDLDILNEIKQLLRAGDFVPNAFIWVYRSTFVMDTLSMELPSSTFYILPLILTLSLLLLFRHRLSGWFLRKATTDEDTLRLVVFGKTGSGKSSTCNTIIGKKAFRVGQGVASGTQHCQSEMATVNGLAISVVDTPGVHATDRSTEDVANEIAKCILLSSPGPHAFLMVVNLNQRFTDQEYAAYTTLKELFGPEVKKYVILAFTWADQLETSIENYLCDVPERLKEILSETGERYLVFNNKGDKSTKGQQVRQLLSLLGAPRREIRLIPYFESSSTKEAATELNERVQQTMEREHISAWKAKERILKGVEANSEEELIRRAQRALGIVEKLANAMVMMAPLFGKHKQTVATGAAAVAAGAREAQNVCTVL